MKRATIWMTLVWLAAARVCAADAGPPESIHRSRGNYENHTARPLRYWPEGTDFVITNGTESFNRPLYCRNSAFRVDGGDRPEFSLYLPGRGGNLRFGVQTDAGVKWLNEADEIVTRYRAGSLVYAIHDSLIGDRELNLTVVPLSETRGLIARVELRGSGSPAKWIFAFGGANGMKGRRGGDIGCEREPIRQFFQLRPEECRGNEFSILSNTFILRSRPATLSGVGPAGAKLAVGDARQWSDPAKLLASAWDRPAPVWQTDAATGGKRAGREPGPPFPVLVGETVLPADQPLYFALEQARPDAPAVLATDALPNLFSAAENHRRSVAEQVEVETPDAFINAAAPALNIAADAIWDGKQQAFMHGAVAWRVRLLGWRGPYAGDELGWHRRTAEHFAGFARQQNTNPVPATIPPADEKANLARNETALHSNGDLTRSHYDMNLVAVDVFFRHLLWTGDLDYARRLWPVIERHFAWERRLFRREFGPDKLPLYEAYAAIWASDNMEYEGGGVAYASAYNCFENEMAARVARLLGRDPAPFEHEARRIRRAMEEYLWLPRDGWFAEYKDYLGLQLVHPNAGLWTFYHTIDSRVPTPVQAWEMSRFVDTQIAHIPVWSPALRRHDGSAPSDRLQADRQPSGREEYFTLPTTSWMPYEWSLNNVVMAEAAHTALAYWQANRPASAFSLFKGCLLDSMFMGKCPGNLGMTTPHDMARGEAQRDFGDAIGTVSRALVEGLFGVRPDALAGELTICPGFPSGWDHAAMKHPDFDFAFRRDGLTETYSIESKFPKPMALRLQVPALRARIASVTVNGRPAHWRVLGDAVGVPRVEIRSSAGARYRVVIVWKGDKPLQPRAPLREIIVPQGADFSAAFGGAQLIRVTDPQQVLSGLTTQAHGFRAVASGALGHRTVFARLKQDEMTWWQPVAFDIQPGPKAAAPPPVNWRRRLPPGVQLRTVNLAPYFNDRVTQIFRHDYRAPRSPFCSLALPKQGIGGWADNRLQFDVDDAGLRAAAARHGGKLVLPNGVPFSTPTNADADNIAFVSQWDNFPRRISVPLTGKAAHVYLLMAGSSNPMQSRFDNGEVIVTYADGTSHRLALRNPTNWWPIDQDYFIDDYAFRRPGPIPPRVDLKTGKVRVLDVSEFKGKGGVVPGGAATVLDMPLNPGKQLKSLTVHALANEVVIGLMAVTLER